MVPTISSNLYIFTVHLSTIGFGDHRGWHGILHTTGAIGQVGGIHSIALTHSYTGITAIGTTTTIHALSAPRTIIIPIIVACMTVFVAMTMRTAIQSVRLLLATLRAM
jgi:hypothetical protein